MRPHRPSAISDTVAGSGTGVLPVTLTYAFVKEGESITARFEFSNNTLAMEIVDTPAPIPENWIEANEPLPLIPDEGPLKES